jgi:hypothetical protein
MPAKIVVEFELAEWDDTVTASIVASDSAAAAGLPVRYVQTWDFAANKDLAGRHIELAVECAGGAVSASLTLEVWKKRGRATARLERMLVEIVKVSE